MPYDIDSVASRWRRYEAAGVSRQIASHDAMFDGNIDHYLRVGKSAVATIAVALLAVRRSSVSSVLDLPCGAGRVTRHLRLFFPDAELFVSDLDKRGENFAAKTFRATTIEASPDFDKPLTRAFDVIFCGSLLTHLPEPRFIRALEWLCNSLAPDGLLVVTIHGRRADHAERNFNHHINAADWERTRAAAMSRGFGFVETEQRGGARYGFSLTAPSWVLRMIEMQPHLRIVSYQEAAWSDHQDALVVQRKPLDLPYQG
jgi:SAM-dependent methyltransferase